jgi:hypothetical protein
MPNIFKKKSFLFIICILLSIIIFTWINYLTNHKYISECFTNNESVKTSHSVDLPLTNTYSCQNFCGPTSRCSTTGQQCFTDIDCPGCQPQDTSSKKQSVSQVIPGDNAAGKLTLGVTPQYSPLTSGYGTHEKIVTKNMFSKPSSPNFGINTWFSSFKKEGELFDKRYKPPQLPNMPNYPKRYSLTGEFVEDGPLASNAVL